MKYKIVYTEHWDELIEALDGMVQAVPLSLDELLLEVGLDELLLAKLKANEILDKVKEEE